MSFYTKAATTSLVAAAMISGSVFAQAPESKDPIKIVTNNWTSQLVLANVVGNVLGEMGYNVEYTPSDTQLQFTAIANGDMHFQVEVWEGSMADSFAKAQESGLVDAGSHDAVTREEWWYPSYMNEMCPGLPDWKALDACAEKFATAETKPKGRFVGPPADWGKHYSERISALGMNFEEVPVGQAATLWAELQAAYDRQEPVVLFNWTPNFIEAKWGMNPDAIYDCGAPKKGWLKKAAWTGMAEKWPGAWGVLQKVNFTNEQIAAAAAMVDVDGKSPEEAAKQWATDNADVVTGWMN